jgi:N-acetyl-gamma-glutamyl-phosphate reductase
MKKAIIIGATGFGGCGLLEILARHSKITVNQLIAKNETGFKIGEMYPHLADFYDLEVKKFEEIDFSDIDIAFFSTPDRAGMKLIHRFIEKDIPVIDYSGDFRFNTQSDYAEYAENKSIETTHDSEEYLQNSVYGLCEKYGSDIKRAKIIGNPGCFAISLILGLLPAEKMDLNGNYTIICDSKSGVSGAGKNPGKANFYPQRYENINTYREGSHQHLIEVEQNLKKFGINQKLFFIPQVIPMTRGILSNIYIQTEKKYTTHELVILFQEYYKDSPFVKIVTKSPDLSFVRGTNYCVIRPLVDSRSGSILITSVIDNLMKGQSGNAVQCANLRLGLDETEGLMITPSYP